MKANLLHVVTAISNPYLWNSRIDLYNQFEEHMIDSGVNLTTVECAYGDRPFQIKPNPHVNHIPVRAKTVSWSKECLLNIGISRLPEDAEYIAWIDADITFRNPTWAADAVHALQLYDIIQPWVDAYDLGPDDEHLYAHKSFGYEMMNGTPMLVEVKKNKTWRFNGGDYPHPHSGYAWCATRKALDGLGGLLDICLLGSGDYHMALALANIADKDIPKSNPYLVSKGYYNAIMQWQERANKFIHGNVGCSRGTIEHSFHGKKVDRKYMDRRQILIDNHFDPYVDIKKNTYGVYELTGNKPKLRKAIDLYFRARNEDINTNS